MSSNVDIFQPDALSTNIIDSKPYNVVRRFPDIIQEIKDSVTLHGNLEAVENEDKLKDCQLIVSRLSDFQDGIKNNSVLKPLVSKSQDIEKWNDYLDTLRKFSEEELRWFNAKFLFVECYFYKNVYEVIQLSTYMKSFDYFSNSKTKSMIVNLKSADILAKMLCQTDQSIMTTGSKEDIFRLFFKYLSLCVWGNRCDLFTTKGETSLNFDPSNIEKLNQNIIVNDSSMLWKMFKEANLKHSGNVTLAFVLDNAGFELFSDLCLVEFLQKLKIVNKVHFYPKQIPWFVSDVLSEDFVWALKTLRDSDYETLSNLGNSWLGRLENGNWKIVESSFWTLPHPYIYMKSVDPELYKNLEEANAVIFKGDLNSRKILGDLQWDFDTPFEIALRGFLPTSLCCLRAIKACCVAGLKDVSDAIKEELKTDWKGTYAVIQCAMKSSNKVT